MAFSEKKYDNARNADKTAVLSLAIRFNVVGLTYFTNAIMVHNSAVCAEIFS